MITLFLVSKQFWQVRLVKSAVKINFIQSIDNRITKTPLLYVRNRQNVAKIRPMEKRFFRVNFCGFFLS